LNRLASARFIAGAVFGSIIGLLLFLLFLTLPAIAVLYGFLWCLQRLLGRLDGSAQIVWNVIVMSSMGGVFMLGVLLGSIVGWGVGGRLASGTPLARSLAGSRFFNRIPLVRSRIAS
jgi:mannose/fructose/N-acetylgalactosamine-specific phosphotransferase system component IID